MAEKPVTFQSSAWPPTSLSLEGSAGDTLRGSPTQHAVGDLPWRSPHGKAVWSVPRAWSRGTRCAARRALGQRARPPLQTPCAKNPVRSLLGPPVTAVWTCVCLSLSFLRGAGPLSTALPAMPGARQASPRTWASPVLGRVATREGPDTEQNVGRSLACVSAPHPPPCHRERHLAAPSLPELC